MGGGRTDRSNLTASNLTGILTVEVTLSAVVHRGGPGRHSQTLTLWHRRASRVRPVVGRDQGTDGGFALGMPFKGLHGRRWDAAIIDGHVCPREKIRCRS